MRRRRGLQHLPATEAEGPEALPPRPHRQDAEWPPLELPVAEPETRIQQQFLEALFPVTSKAQGCRDRHQRAFPWRVIPRDSRVLCGRGAVPLLRPPSWPGLTPHPGPPRSVCMGPRENESKQLAATAMSGLFSLRRRPQSPASKPTCPVLPQTLAWTFPLPGHGRRSEGSWDPEELPVPDRAGAEANSD